LLSSTAVRDTAAPSREATASPQADLDPPIEGPSSLSPREGHAVVGASHDATNRLMDSLLHDARNPLNALAINLEVLAEKLKDEDGKVPESQDKNIRAMRDQIFRVDAILRQFSDFLAPKPGRGELNLSEVIARAVEVVGHESRRRRVKLKAAIDPNVTVPEVDSAAIHVAAVQLLLRAILRSDAGAEVAVAVDRHGSEAVFTVSDSAADVLPATSSGSAAAPNEPLPLALAAVRHLGSGQGTDGFRVAISGGTVQLTFGGRS
jgi:signal transduction histidine kinase